MKYILCKFLQLAFHFCTSFFVNIRKQFNISTKIVILELVKPATFVLQDSYINQQNLCTCH